MKVKAEIQDAIPHEELHPTYHSLFSLMEHESLSFGRNRFPISYLEKKITSMDKNSIIMALKIYDLAGCISLGKKDVVYHNSNFDPSICKQFVKI